MRQKLTKNRKQGHRRQKSVMTVALAGTLTASMFGFAPTTAWASSSGLRWGPVAMAGQTWHNVPYVVSDNTTFFGIWYLQQMLKDYGITATWNGVTRTLSLDSLPQEYASSSLVVNDVQASNSPTLTYGGKTFINVSSLATSVGGTVSYQSTNKSLNMVLPSASTGGANGSVTNGANSVSAHYTSGSTADLSVSAHPASAYHAATTSTELGYVKENGKLWRTVPILRRDGTTFFGVWYLQQLLKAHGVANGWNGKELTISALPKMVKGATIQIGATAKTSTLIQLGNDWYADTDTLRTFGLNIVEDSTSHDVAATIPMTTSITVQGHLENADGSPLQGKVAIQDATGDVHVVDTDSSGLFATMLTTLGGSLIGIDTPDDGWTGQAISFTGNTTSLVAQDVQRMSTIHGHLMFRGTPFDVPEISVRNVVTHAHYYALVNADGSFEMTVPEGSYEAYAAVTDTDAVYLAQPFLTTGDTTNLTVSIPANPSDSSVKSAHAVVSAGDGDITPEELLSVSDLFEHVYTSTTQRNGLKPSGKINITLYGSADTYKQHFLDEGYSDDEASQIADASVAAEEGTDTISVLMPSYSTVDGMNILAHEFTHALVATVSSGIESWANEGIAWVNGIDGELDQSPDSVLREGEQWYEWVDIVAHQQAGDLIPLGDSNPLDGNYNVEDQDYYAVQQLIDEYGMDKFLQYVRAIDSDPDAFLHTFGKSFNQFSQEVTQSLQQRANQGNTSFTVRLKVLPGGANSLYVINPAGQTMRITGLQEGHSYTLTCNEDGSVVAPTGLQIQSSDALPVVYDGDWYIGSGADGVLDRQEFEVEYKFGTPFLVQAILYTSDNQIDHAYPATATSNGIQLIDLSGGTIQ